MTSKDALAHVRVYVKMQQIFEFVALGGPFLGPYLLLSQSGS